MNIYVRFAAIALIAALLCPVLSRADASTTSQTLTEARPTMGSDTSQLLHSLNTDIGETTGLPQFVNEFGEPIVLRPIDLIAMTLERNYSLKIQSYEEAMAGDSIEQERGIYDLTLNANASLTHTRSQNQAFSNRFQSLLTSGDARRDSIQDTRNGEIELAQLTPTGARLSVGTGIARGKRDEDSAGAGINPEFQRNYAIELTQPLLKNFGPFVTNAQINIARKQHAIAQLRFEQEAQAQIADALKAYWDLVFAISNAEVNRASLESAEKLRNNQKIRFDAGVVDKVTVLQAEAGVAARQGNYISARNGVRDIQDQIKKLVESDEPSWNRNYVPISLSPPVLEYPTETEAHIETAIAARPDLRQLDISQRILEINAEIARNQLLPELNAFASYGLNGAGETAEAAEEAASSNDYDEWTVGLEFQFPLQNRAARYNRKKAKRDVEQGKIEIANLRNSVIQQVRFDNRAIETNRQLIQLANTSIEAEQAKLEAEEKRFAEGLSTSQDLLDFQEDLQQARTNYLRAIVDYNKAIIDLERDKGTLLDTLRIQIVGPEL